MHRTLPSIQAPAAVVMVRPHRFHPNPQTAADNAFQRHDATRAAAETAAAAFDEATQAAATLAQLGVRVHLFDDDGSRDTPDAVFPNNWFSTHPGGHVAIYPMHSPNRRRERRADVIELLKAEYRVQDVIDYSGLEPDGRALGADRCAGGADDRAGRRLGALHAGRRSPRQALTFTPFGVGSEYSCSRSGWRAGHLRVMSAPRPAVAGRPPRRARKVAAPHFLVRLARGSVAVTTPMCHL